MTNKYFQILDLLISGNINKPKKPDLRSSNSQISQEFPTLHSQISKILRKINPEKNINEKNKIININQSEAELSLKKRHDNKKVRKKLFDDPDKDFEKILSTDGIEYQKSACPEFSNVLFQGQTVLTNTPWEIKVPKPKIEEIKIPLPSLPTAQINIQGFNDLPISHNLEKDIINFLSYSSRDNNENIKPTFKALMDIIDSVTKQIIDMEINKDDLNDITNLVETEEKEENLFIIKENLIIDNNNNKNK